MTTLARLYLAVASEHRDAFAAYYSSHLAPILAQHDLVNPLPVDRATPAEGFARLYEVVSPSSIREKARTLTQDSRWQAALCHDRFGSIHFVLEHYSSPAHLDQSTLAQTDTWHEGWRTLEVTDGLPAPFITSLAQDSADRLWVGTYEGGGLACFDGHSFHTYTMPCSAITALAPDPGGSLWIGTPGGLLCFDGHTFHTYTRADGLPSNKINCLLNDPAGGLWIGTQNGLCRYNGYTFHRHPTVNQDPRHQQVQALCRSDQGLLWIGTQDGLCRYDGQGISVILTTANGLPPGPITALMELAGQLWIGTEHGLCHYNGHAVHTLSPQHGLPQPNVTTLLKDRDQRLWVGTKEGLYLWDGTALVIEEALRGKTIIALLEDRRGQRWIGTYDGLLHSLPPSLTNFSHRDGVPHNVMSLAQRRDGHLFLGTSFGVCHYDGKAFRTYTTADGLGDDWTMGIWIDCNNRVWSTGEKLTCFDGRSFTCYTASDGLPTIASHTLGEDRQGRLLVGDFGGHLCRFDGQDFTSLTGDRPLGITIMCLVEDRQGQLWIGTAGKGAFRYDGTEFHPVEALRGRFVKAVLEDRSNRIWFATDDGLFCAEGEEYTRYSTDDGLAHNHTTSLCQGREGRLWIGTWCGVNGYDGQIFQTLDKRDGLLNNAIQKVLEDPHGVLWIATEGGVSRYQPEATPPGVQLKHLVADRIYLPHESIAVPFSQHRLRFEFAGHSWSTRPAGFAYLVRLQGVDPNWKAVYADWIAYQDLPVGEYVFQVRAVDRNLKYSAVAQIRFTIEPDVHLQSLTAVLNQSGPQGDFVGQSPALKKVQDQLRQIAPAEATVLIQGETGTGKGLAARTLHRLSPRREAPFMVVNCGAIPESLIESELFGHEKGAFTGASSRRLGKVELAEGGTLFLDEIGDLPLTGQVKLLRLLEERTFERVGSAQELGAQVRVVAATNRDLRAMVAEGTFREDLYYRLSGFEIQVPSLRQRREDIPLLVLSFIGPKAAHLSKPVHRLSKAAEAVLVSHPWPGNVRELQHAIERAVVVCQSDTIEVEDLSLSDQPDRVTGEAQHLTLAEHERRYIRAVLADTDGRISGPSGAATILGLHESSLRARMKRLGIQRP